VPEFVAHPALPEQRAAARFSAVHRRLLLRRIAAALDSPQRAGGAAIGLHLGHLMDRAHRRSSTGCAPAAILCTISPLSFIAIFKHIEIFQYIFQT
jgi:hypothetical protein